MKAISPDIEYQDRIQDLNIDKIEPNKFNPRERFNEEEEDELIESILTKGILNPITVYKSTTDNKYIILDGERRFKAFKKLNETVIPCHVLEKEPTELENLSLMFHIHNVREEWTDFAIAQALLKVIEEMGKKVNDLERQDKLELVKITSLSEYKINKYLVFYDYPQSILDKFMHSEMQEEPDKGMDPDILAEMHGPIKIIEQEIPDFLKRFSKEKIIDACIKKKAKGIIKTNRDFRALTKSLTAMKKGGVRKEVMFEKLESFIRDLEVTPQSIFEDTSETIYQVDSIIKKTELLIKEVQNLNLNQVTREEKIKIEKYVSTLTQLLKTKLK